MDLYLQGFTQKQISDTVDMKQTQLSIVVNSPNFQHELALRRQKKEDLITTKLASVTQEARDLLRENTKKAAERIIGLLDSEDESIQRQSANDLLDRAGIPKVQKQESKNLSAVVVLSSEDVSRLREGLLMDS